MQNTIQDLLTGARFITIIFDSKYSPETRVGNNRPMTGNLFHMQFRRIVPLSTVTISAYQVGMR